MLGAVGALPCHVDALVRIPPVSARGPGQLGREAVEEVLQGPGQDHDVVDVAVGRDDGGADPNSRGPRGSNAGHGGRPLGDGERTVRPLTTDSVTE